MDIALNYLKNSDLKQEDLAKKIGVSRGYLNNLINSKKDVSPLFVEKMYTRLPDFKKLIDSQENPKKDYVHGDIEPVEVIQEPIIQYAQAGTINTAETMNQYDVRKIIGTNEMIKPFKIIGDSMKPNFVDGEIVYASPLQSLDDIIERHVYVLETTSRGLIVKRLKYKPEDKMIICISDNQIVHTFSIHESEVIGAYRFRAKISFNAIDPNTLYHRVSQLEEAFETFRNQMYKIEEKM